jgi:hypothetical protein
MHEIVVIHSDEDGLWHLCYSDPANSKFHSIQGFVSKDMAEAMAYKMNCDRIIKAGEGGQ